MTNEVSLSLPALTVYERLGGEAGLRAAVDLFYERVMADGKVAPFFEKIAMPRLKGHQFAFLSQVLGGPRQYTGESMARAHAHLPIEQQHFDAVAGHLVETLRGLGAGEEVIGDVVAQIAPLAPQIVKTDRENHPDCLTARRSEK